MYVCSGHKSLRYQWLIGLHIDQRDIQHQISLMLERLFAALKNFPFHLQSLPEFNYIFKLLSRASKDSTSPLSLRVAQEVVVQGIPSASRKRKSISLALALAQSTIQWGLSWNHFNLSETPFVTLDKSMLEIWSEQEGIEGRTEVSLLKWQQFRSSVRHWCKIDLDDLHGPLPTWSPSAAHTDPSKLHKFLSVLGINMVCISYISVHLALLTFMY